MTATGRNQGNKDKLNSQGSTIRTEPPLNVAPGAHERGKAIRQRELYPVSQAGGELPFSVLLVNGDLARQQRILWGDAGGRM